MQFPRTGPIRHIDSQVVILSVAGPHWETQVVAYQGENAPTLKVHQHPLSSTGITGMFTGHTKQMALIVMDITGIRTHPYQAIEIILTDFHHERSEERRVGKEVRWWEDHR